MLARAAAAALLAAGAAAQSPDAALYVCDASKLASEDLCYFAASPTNTVGASPHNIDRSVAPDGRRQVVDVNGTALAVTPKPWTQGDELGAAPAALSGDLLGYANAFELVAPLRDAMMFAPKTVAADAARWAALTRAFRDCKIKGPLLPGYCFLKYGADGQGAKEGVTALVPGPNGTCAALPGTDINNAAGGASVAVDDEAACCSHCADDAQCKAAVYMGSSAGGVYSVDGIYTVLKSAGGQDTHNPILRFLEEGAIELVCLMTGLDFQAHCPAIRAANGIVEGQTSTCWKEAYKGLYGSK